MSEENLKLIRACVENQNLWRGKKTINLIASENVLSQTAKSMSYSDFAHRYAEGVVYHREYQGQRYHDEIEQIAIDSVKNLFDCNFADVRCPAATTHYRHRSHPI